MKRAPLVALLFALGSSDARALVYSTFLGGSSGEPSYALCVDGSNGIAVTGSTSSDNFPTTQGVIDRGLGGRSDIFISRFSPDGTRLLFSTHLGGDEREVAYDIGLEADAGFAIVGYSLSDNFPTTNGAYDRQFNDGETASRDIVVAKINLEGNRLRFSTYVGGSETETGQALAVTEAGNVVFSGNTYSTDFPTTEGVVAPNHHGGNDRIDLFVASLNADGSELVYATYLGGSEQEEACEVILHGENVVVIGSTNSQDFQTTEGTLDGSPSYDTFITCLNSDASELVFGTYVGGGNNGDYGNAGCIDVEGNFVVSGRTECDDFPVSEGVFDNRYNGDYDMFVAKINEDGTERLYATYLGGSTVDMSFGICRDSESGVVIAGVSASNNYPVTDGSYDDSFGGVTDIVVTRLSHDGDELLYSTFVGGEYEDRIEDILPYKDNIVAMTGYTYGDDFPTTDNAYDRQFNGANDAVVIKVDVTPVEFVELQWIDVPPDTFDVYETDYIEFNVRGIGPEGRELRIIYMRNGLPNEAIFIDQGDGSGTFEWQTDYEDAGFYAPIFRLTDGRTSVDLRVFIIVRNVNRPPEFFHLADSLWVNEGELLESVVTATDPDGDLVELVFDPQLPAGWTFTDHGDGSGLFSWQPDFDEAGEYTANVYASDGQVGVDTTMIITVKDVILSAPGESAMPTEYFLADAFPNPFNSSTTIRFGLPVAGEVSLSVYYLSGKKVADLVGLGGPTYAAGWHEVVWEAGNVPAGVYLIEMQTAGGKLSKRVALIK